MSDDDNLPGDAISAHAPSATVMERFTVWARVVEGVVAELRKLALSEMALAFGDTTDRVLNVTAVPCAVGYHVDTAGNVAPPPAAGTVAHMPGPGAAPALFVEKAPVPPEVADESSEAATAQHEAAVKEAHGNDVGAGGAPTGEQSSAAKPVE